MSGFNFSITLVQLNYFHKLAETRHFAEAARQLYITQPTLSASIKALEEELGVSLVYREGRRNVRLTKQGVAFEAKVASILEELRLAIDEVSGRGARTDKPISVGTIPTIQYDFLPGVLRGYWDKVGYDKGVNIAVEFTNQLVKGLKEQDYDVVFCSRVPEETDLAFIPMVTKPLVAVVAKDGPYRELESLSLERLEEMPFTTYRESTPIGRETRALLDSTGLKLDPSIAFDDEFSLAGYVVASGDVVGVMLDTFEIDPFKDRVRVVPVAGVDDAWHSICMAYDRRLIRGERLETFIETAMQSALA